MIDGRIGRRKTKENEREGNRSDGKRRDKRG
jgi:hypothetical protein